MVGLLVLFYQKTHPFNEPKSVQWVVDSKIAEPKPIITEEIREIAKKQAIKEQVANQPSQTSLKKAVTSGDKGFGNIKLPTNVKGRGNGSASSSNYKSNGNSGNKNVILPKLRNNTQATVYDIECQKIDKEDRPKGCPPSSTARRLALSARAPKYRPDLVVGLTRAEVNARRYAGIREKCEQENGTKYMNCISIGKTPPRVKTPYELCMEAGLGGCTRPPHADGTPDQALNYGN